MIAAVAVAEGKSLSCNEMWSAGFFAGLFAGLTAGLTARSSLLYHHLRYDDLLLGDALHLAETPVCDGGGRVFDDVPIPRSDVSEASIRTCRVIRVVFSEFSRVLCCWSWGHWVGCS